MTGTRQPRPPRARPGPGWWLRRGLLALVAGLAVAIAIDVARGGISAIVFRYGGYVVYVPQGERVEIADGHSLYLDCRGSGSPTVVLEAGMGTDSATWSPVHDKLAEITRTCSYDRTGRGRSDGGSAGDLHGQSRELSALLASSGEPGPYVVVGHSFGSVLGRVHAALDPDAVAGLVLVDGFDPDLFDQRVVPILGPLREEFVNHTTVLWDMVGRVEGIDVPTSQAQLAAADLGDLPLEALWAPRADQRLDDATNVAIQEGMRDGYDDLTTGPVTFTVAWGAGHMVQFDRPDLVVDAVRRLVDAIRG